MRSLLSALLLGLVSPLGAQSASRDWRPEDRTVIGDFSRITSIATSLERVFVTSPTELLVYRPQFQQWEGPFDPPDRYVLNRVFGSLVDPLDNSVWLARPDGWVHFQPDLRVWDQGDVPEGILAIAFDQADPVGGLYLRTRRGWELLPRGGLVATPTHAPARPVSPVSVDEVLRSSPTLQANAAQILTDPRLRSVRYTAAARSFDNQGWYLGTSGIGLLFLPDGAALPQRLTYGLPSSRVGAVTRWPGGVWAATDRTGQADAGLTFVGESLSTFRTLHGLPATGLPFTLVRDLAGWRTAIWAATDAGLARVETKNGRVDLADGSRGLPDSRVYAVIARQERVTVGTARGLARVDDSMRVERLVPDFSDAVVALYPTGDSVWVGTARGLFLAAPGARNVTRPAALASVSLQPAIVAMASLGDTIVALSRDQLLWRNPGTSAWTLGPNLSGVLGRLCCLAADGAGFWVAGERGIGFARLNTPPLRALHEGDLPAVANDLAVDAQYLWVATDGGLVRFALTAIRP